MADFDDLIPKSSSENPFANPFADVGRPRSPDPWSLGASYYEDPQQAFGISQTQSGSDEPDIPDDASKLLGQPLPDDTLLEETQAQTADSLDAHAEDVPGSRTEPLVPLSSVDPGISPPSDLSAKVSSAKEVPPYIPSEEQNQSRANSITPPSEIALQNDSPLDSQPNLSALNTSSPGYNHLPPPKTPLSAAPDPTDSISPPLTARFTSPRGNASSPSPDHTPFQERERIISPLTTPNFGAIQNSFNSLALGGEAPGWAPANLDPHMAPIQSTYRSAPPSKSVDNEDEDDDRPLGTLRHQDEAQSSNTVDMNSVATQIIPTESEQVASPQFVITVGDPQKVGDPINAHIVYTVSTKTTAAEFKKSSFSVLRRYSDFLWLFDALSVNNPGVVIPPVPEKMPFGRFAEGFIESRRLALNRCIQKIASHPKLALDPDLRLFLESDSFALDIKHKKADNDRAGLIASLGTTITGPKFYETDEWFDKKRSYLDILESQLKGWIKAVETVSKHRAEIVTSIVEFADAINILGGSDLSKQLSSSLNVLADVERKSKELMEQQSRLDMETVLGTVEEYLRLIASVRLAFASRVKMFYAWKYADAEKARVRTMHEKTLRQRGLDRQLIIPLQREIELAETKAQDARSEYDNVTKLIKLEVGRFEQERVMDFKASMEAFLEGMISRQSEIIDAWEQYQQLLLKRASMNP